MRRLVVSSALGATGVAAVVELLSREGSPGLAYQLPAQAQFNQTATSTQVSAPQGYVYLGPLSGISGKTAAYFTHPNHGSSIIVDDGGTWKAFSAICTHAPCNVGYAGSSMLYCPCHGATFSTTNGDVTGGPAPRALAEYAVQILNGDVYVTTARIN